MLPLMSSTYILLSNFIDELKSSAISSIIPEVLPSHIFAILFTIHYCFYRNRQTEQVNEAFAVLLVVLIKVFAGGLAAIFVNYDDGLMKLTTNAIRLYSWSFMLCWFNIHAGAMFVALNNGPVSSVLSFTRTLVFQLGSVLLLPIIIGTDGIWLSITLAEMLAAAVSVAALLRNREKYQYI